MYINDHMPIQRARFFFANNALICLSQSTIYNMLIFINLNTLSSVALALDETIAYSQQTCTHLHVL